MIKTGSDFSGVGAFDQALKKLGIDYKTIFACDWDKYARQTYIENYGKPTYFPKDVYEREIPKESLDIYMTSPPCQAFSIAGKRKGENDERGILFYNSHEFIQKNNPRYFIFENVKGLLSDANGNTFKVWLDMLGGKSVNGNPVLFPNEKSTPYHIYWQVLNAKNYGVPQNRERVFIIGIRDDADNTFRFPKKQHLTKKLKDVLEHSVDDKYFLSENMVKYFTDNQKGKGNGRATDFLTGDEDNTNCLLSSYWKQPKDGIYLKVPSATKKGFEIATDQDSINFSVPNSKTRRGRVGKGVAQTLDTACNQGVVVYNIPQIVSVRKHKVDIIKLQGVLKKYKTISNQKIAEKLNIKKTTVDHWFRTDDGFSIPEANIWQDLKSLLEIKTDEFDKSITEFETREGVFEKANRVYDTKGIAPTMTSTSADERILLGNKNYIRRLTPRECFRLMDFPNTFKWSVSDTQAYKQAGNSIVVNVLAEIIKKLKL